MQFVSEIIFLKSNITIKVVDHYLLTIVVNVRLLLG